MSGTISVTAGFLPLTDSMILIAAKEQGFAEEAGIDLVLSKQVSWASIRDHMAVGQFDVAHMLAPMPIAFNTGLVPFSVPIIAPMALGLGGNAITVSRKLWDKLASFGVTADAEAKKNGEALKHWIDKPGKQARSKLRFGVVHPFSGHNLELRYWLSASGVDPDNDVEILIIPPPLMPDALSSGQIDGYCVGEPWNSVSVEAGTGCILTTKSEIWHTSPEKVLGVRSSWADENPDVLSKLLIALFDSAKWCAEAENREKLSQILSDKNYVGVSAPIIKRALDGRIELIKGTGIDLPDFLIPFDRAATFPWQSHALWFYTQMVRWRQMEHTAENLKTAYRSYRPDLYRKALSQSNAALPAASMKVEGALRVETAVGSSGRLTLGPDGFFDGKTFDPDQIDDYLDSLS